MKSYRNIRSLQLMAALGLVGKLPKVEAIDIETDTANGDPGILVLGPEHDPVIHTGLMETPKDFETIILSPPRHGRVDKLKLSAAVAMLAEQEQKRIRELEAQRQLDAASKPAGPKPTEKSLKKAAKKQRQLNNPNCK